MHIRLSARLRAPLIALLCIASSALATPENSRPRILIVMGSVREERIAAKMADAVKNLVDAKKIDAQVVDLAQFGFDTIPFGDTPQNNTTLATWADMINTSDALLLLVPNYNEGVPGVLLQAINSTASAWNNKPVAAIAYAGGFAGQSPINTLARLFKRLGITSLLDKTVYISFGQSSFDPSGSFKKKETAQAVTDLLGTITNTVAQKKGSHETR